MLKHICIVIATFMLAGCSKEGTKRPTPAVQVSGLPAGAIQKGTLANAKLIEDAKVGVVAKAATLGITNLIKADIFVMQMPEGEPGSRHWKEKWIVTDGTKNAEVDIRFQETGLGAANWTIE